jgi:hypothetical protein
MSLIYEKKAVAGQSADQFVISGKEKVNQGA